MYGFCSDGVMPLPSSGTWATVANGLETATRAKAKNVTMPASMGAA